LTRGTHIEAVSDNSILPPVLGFRAFPVSGGRRLLYGMATKPGRKATGLREKAGLPRGDNPVFLKFIHRGN
jgi:hypothetical protein